MSEMAIFIQIPIIYFLLDPDEIIFAQLQKMLATLFAIVQNHVVRRVILLKNKELSYG
jgi:hypothetical protein